MVELAQEVKSRNEEKALYCSECCTRFTLYPSGDWITDDIGYDPKIAEVIHGTLIQCTCGTNIGIVVEDQLLIGEVLPVN